MSRVRAAGRVIPLLAAALLATFAPPAGARPPQARRVPAEWEPQEAIWLQWPQRFEKTYEPAFARISAIILRYENLHILVNDARTEQEARRALREIGGLDLAQIDGRPGAGGQRLTWHTIPNDNAWMRDNGPRYVVVDGRVVVQNWEFDAWGGGFGPRIPFANDNAVPDAVAGFLGLSVEHVPLVHERGDLEFNGVDTVLVNWSVIGDPRRNPGLTRGAAVSALKRHFGVSRVVMIEGAPSGDGTGGHVDGIARFISSTRVVVADCTERGHCRPGDTDDAIYDDAAERLARAGLEVERMPFEAAVTYRGQTFDTDYLNWLVGNGFVIAVGFGHPRADAGAIERLERWFPGRDVHMVEMLDSWIAGGGVHCHTNDQPALLQSLAVPDRKNGS